MWIRQAIMHALAEGMINAVHSLLHRLEPREASILRARFGEALPVRVCTIRTDPWTLGHLGFDGERRGEQP